MAKTVLRFVIIINNDEMKPGYCVAKLLACAIRMCSCTSIKKKFDSTIARFSIRKKLVMPINCIQKNCSFSLFRMEF